MQIERVDWTTAIALIVLLLSGCEDRNTPSISEFAALHGIPPVAGEATVDPHLPEYEPSELPALGSIRLTASAATLPIAQHWATALNAEQPSILLRTETVDSESPARWWSAGLAPAAALLYDDIGGKERQAFEREWGYPPLRLTVAMDPLVIIVHPDNPLAAQGLSLSELDAVFGRPRQRADGAVRRWKDLGISGPLSERAIEVYGEDSAGPSYSPFRKKVLHNRDFRSDLIRLPESRAIVAAVTDHPAAIGYARLSTVSGTVAAVPIGKDDGPRRIQPAPMDIIEGDAPLPGGFLYLYLNRQPDMVLNAPYRELVRYIYSREGQRIAAELGLLSVPALFAGYELRRTGINLSPDGLVLAGLFQNPGSQAALPPR